MVVRSGTRRQQGFFGDLVRRTPVQMHIKLWEGNDDPCFCKGVIDLLVQIIDQISALLRVIEKISRLQVQGIIAKPLKNDVRFGRVQYQLMTGQDFSRMDLASRTSLP